MEITVEQFNEFWRTEMRYESTLVKDNRERFHNNLETLIMNCKTVEDLDFAVEDLKKGKECTRQVVLAFYDYLSKKYGVEIYSSLKDKRFYDSPDERRLEIAKYLHSARSMDEITKEFGINNRTAREDLQLLEEGFNFMGTTISLEKEKIGRKYMYRCSFNPIFLPLNLTEVYALTVYLDHIIKIDDPNAQIIKSISKRVKNQLSDYAYEKLYNTKNNREPNYYRQDQELAESREGIVGYLMKSGDSCSFYWRGEQYRGAIIYIVEKGYCVKLEDGSVLDADIKDLDFIIDSLEYK